MFIAKSSQQDLVVLRELMESGKIRPVIGRRYELSETASQSSIWGKGTPGEK